MNPTDRPFRGVEELIGDTGPEVEDTSGDLSDLPDDVYDGDADPGADDVDHPEAKDHPDDPNDEGEGDSA
jgi:hypothetical protein